MATGTGNGSAGPAAPQSAVELPFRDLIVLTQYYKPEPGAPQIRLAAMVRELRRLGVRVRVVTGMPNYPLGEIFEGYRGKLSLREEIEGVPVRRVWLYPASGRGSLRRLLNYLSFTVSGLVALLGEEPADLVFVEAQPVTLALAGWMLKTLGGVDYVYNTPDLQVEHAEEAGWLRGPGLIRAARGLEAFLMRRSLSVTTVTHAFVRHFIETRGVPARRMTYLPNGADTERLRPLPRDEEYARRMGVGERKVFTYAGTHAPYQGLEVIVEAARLLRHRDDLAILMVGKGPIRESLRRRASEAGLDNVLFRDSPFEEMERLMSISYASLITLRDQPTAEKMRLSKTIPPLACGVPVIFAGRGESAGMVETGRCGIRVEPEDPALLARAIEELADDPERRAAMGHRGRELAEREFSWRALVRDWVRQVAAVKAGRSAEIPGFDYQRR